MSCDETRPDLYALMDRELDAAERTTVLRHLAECPRCRRTYEADRRLTALLQQYLAFSPVAPPDLWRCVARRIEHEERRERLPWSALARRFRPVRDRRWGWAVAGAVVTVVVALLLAPGPAAPTSLVEEIVTDHLRSVARATGPADVPSGDLATILGQFRDRVRIPIRVPGLASHGLRVVGGSFCQLRATKGIRFTYELGTGQTLSFYELERPTRAAFPLPGEGRFYFGPLEPGRGPRLVLWSDGQSVYAFVGEIPPSEIQRLASLI